MQLQTHKPLQLCVLISFFFNIKRRRIKFTGGGKKENTVHTIFGLGKYYFKKPVGTGFHPLNHQLVLRFIERMICVVVIIIITSWCGGIKNNRQSCDLTRC